MKKSIIKMVTEGTKKIITANFHGNDVYLIDNDVSKLHLSKAILEFEIVAYDCLKKMLVMPICEFQRMSDSTLDIKSDYPVIFHGEYIYPEPGKRRFCFLVAKTDDIRSSAGFGTGGPRSECYLDNPNEKILSLGRSKQIEIAERVIGTNLRSLLNSLRKQRRFFEFNLPDLNTALEEAPNGVAFLQNIASQVYSEKRVSGSKSKEFMLWFFLAFLRRKNFILLPTSNHKVNLFEPEYRNIFSNHIFSEEKLKMLDILYNQSSTFSIVRTRIAQVLFLSSTFESSGDVTFPLLKKIVEEVFFVSESESSNYKLFSHARAVYEKIATIWNENLENKNIKADKRFVPTFEIPKETNVKNEFGNEKRDPFWFVYVDNLSRRRYHPLKNYTKNETIIVWAQILRSTFPFLKIKDPSQYRIAGRMWLIYIHSIENPPANIQEIIRSVHIHDIIPSENHTFRKFLNEEKISHDGKSEAINGLATIFDLYIRVNHLDIRNPIDIVIDNFPRKAIRGKTPRTPLSPEMLEYIKEFNSRDDFSFSKSFTPKSSLHNTPQYMGHYREITDKNGKVSIIWWPSLPILIDLLLTIPLRGFQGRWLDSGEGDELQIDPYTLEELTNISEARIKNRSCGVFIKYDGSMQEKDDFLGLRISTNKKLVDEDGEYDIPWCPDNVRDNISRLIAWQKKYNPINLPVRAEESTINSYRAAEVDALLPEVFPIFRDPLNKLNRPPTYMQVNTYWSHLCSAVEDELIEKKGTKFRLTRDRMNNRVMQRVALFDLHTLRVSGITALIEAGLPPSMVQEIVGHATIIMTLYYNKIHPSKINETIMERLLAADWTIDKIPEILSDLPEYEKFLFNSRNADDAVGMDFLQSSIGNGSFQILSHSICPGGDCRTGGKYCNLKKEHAPVPRAGACSLCRYRFTGPMFLVGLVNNANKIMSELFAKGQSLAALNDEIRALRRENKNSIFHESKREIYHRELENLWTEWAAEVKYIKTCSDKLAEYLEKNDNGQELSLLGQSDAIASITVRPERHHHFFLHQSLAKASIYNPADIDTESINNRDIFINELLANNHMDPFLLRLDKKTKLQIGNLLGDLLLEQIPESDLQKVHDGEVSIKTFANLDKALKKISRETNSSLNKSDQRLAR